MKELCRLRIRRGVTAVHINVVKGFNNTILKRRLLGQPFELFDNDTVAILADTNDIYIVSDKPIYFDGGLEDAFSYGGYLKFIDISGMNGKCIKSMMRAFADCNALKEIRFCDLKINKCNNLSGAFASCYKLNKIDLRGLELKRVDHVDAMCIDCVALEEIHFDEELFTYASEGIVKNFNRLFMNCHKLKKINNDNVIKLPDSADAGNMFKNCSSLENIKIIGKLYYAGNMFEGCTNLKTVDMSEAYFAHKIDVSNMFQGCTSLETLIIPNIANADIVIDDIKPHKDGTQSWFLHMLGLDHIPSKFIYQ